MFRPITGFIGQKQEEYVVALSILLAKRFDGERQRSSRYAEVVKKGNKAFDLGCQNLTDHQGEGCDRGEIDQTVFNFFGQAFVPAGSLAAFPRKPRGAFGSLLAVAPLDDNEKYALSSCFHDPMMKSQG